MNNRDMVRRFAAKHQWAIPVGSAGCMGDGMALAESAGGRLERMENAESGRSLLMPPAS